ncbi:MAG: A/G-specific adenine glycosylase [Bradymonadaceae bacterium]|nr:A/G-specific adenine glycosylase [Lujinxingiaceae bacterium]
MSESETLFCGRTASQISALRADLLGWYDEHQRALPWRGSEDPYAVWVSEIMLQQTQVATVIAYYERWMVSFPSVEALAEATSDEVLEAWAGLGYYRRARALHAGAQLVVGEHAGKLPSDLAGLRSLPGVGAYTAGAIASIAFGQVEPLVDGNVARVLSRLWALSDDPKSGSGARALWEIAAGLVDPARPGDFNQALMELGATVCSPKSPACLICPLREACEGYSSGQPTDFPPAQIRVRQKPVGARTAIVQAGIGEQARYLIVQRPADGLLGGLWEFPTVVVAGRELPCVELLDAYLAKGLGLDSAASANGRALGRIVHHFSHLKMTIEAELRQIDADQSAMRVAEGARFVDAAGLEQVAMSAAMRKIENLVD